MADRDEHPHRRQVRRGVGVLVANPRAGATGLVARHLVTSHGGKVWAEAAKGGGAAFSFYFAPA